MKVGVSISLTPPLNKNSPFHKALVNNTNFTKMFICETLHNAPTYICLYVISNQCSLLSLPVHSLFCTSISYHSYTHDRGLGLGQYKSLHTNSLFFFFSHKKSNHVKFVIFLKLKSLQFLLKSKSWKDSFTWSIK